MDVLLLLDWYFNFRGNVPLNLDWENTYAKRKGGSMTDQKVRVKCPECAQIFRERARKLRNGFETNCQHCNRLIAFDSSSEDNNIRQALRNAREIRIASEVQAQRERLADGSVNDHRVF